MDDLSHRLANAAVGNPDSAAALEVTLTGPTLKFFVDSGGWVGGCEWVGAGGWVGAFGQAGACGWVGG